MESKNKLDICSHMWLVAIVLNSIALNKMQKLGQGFPIFVPQNLTCELVVLRGTV